MTFDDDASGTMQRRMRRVRLALTSALLAQAQAAGAAPPVGTKILTCKDAAGRTLITDPADPRCYKPPPTEPEKAEKEAQRRKQMDAYLACKTEQRSNQSLLNRYPNQEKHDAARRQALDQVDTSMRIAQSRMARLLAERVRLRNEEEFYPSGNLPPKLRRDIDSNSALIEGQAQAIASLKDEAAQKNAFYDDELGMLRILWQPRTEARGCAAPQN